MGDCYSIELKLKYKDSSNVLNVFKSFIEESNRSVNWNLDKYAKDGITTESVDDMARILLAGWKGQRVNILDEDGWRIYSNAFDASYGWNGVMQDTFVKLCEADVIDNGSYIEIWSDDAGNFRIYKDESTKRYHYEDINNGFDTED